MTLKFEYNTKANTDHNLFKKSELASKLTAFKNIIAKNEIGFFQLTERTELIDSTKIIHEQIKKKKHFIQIGIGGSALGPQMLISSLRKKWDKTFTLLDNTDSDYIQDELNKIDLLNSIFYVVSKSGGTAETVACYIVVRNLLIQSGIKEDDLGQYFVFCTDKDNGQLREHVNKHNYRALEVPNDVGGRFSVLTHVGLLPAIFFGIDIEKLFTSTNKYKQNLLNENVLDNDLLRTAAHLASLYFENGVNETVLMPYSSKLKDFSHWFVQLWSESLGKYSERNQKHEGFTPVPAYGATDQHAQVQLFMEGPHNKCLFLVSIRNKDNNFKLDSNLDLESARKLSQYDMNQLMDSQFSGTVKALEGNDRNLITITIDSLDEESLAALVIFFESLTALMGEYLLVDPFNQPGVENGKLYAFEYLNNL